MCDFGGLLSVVPFNMWFSLSYADSVMVRKWSYGRERPEIILCY